MLLFVISGCVFGEVPENTRKEYAIKFHEAFVLQSMGRSTVAFHHFLEAFNLGKNSGESSAKLQIIADLFYWYRQHGACMRLFGKQPSERDKIHGEYCNCSESHELDETINRSLWRLPIIASPQGIILAVIPDYRSEYGTNPQQAVLVRDFIFGAGEIIAGVLLISVGKSIVSTGLGSSMVYSGVKTMWNTGNMLWGQHESALLELKKLTDRAQAVAK